VLKINTRKAIKMQMVR